MLRQITARVFAVAAIAVIVLLGAPAAADDRCVDHRIDEWLLTGCLESDGAASWSAVGTDASFWLWIDDRWRRQSAEAADALAYLNAVEPSPEIWDAPHPYYDRSDWESFPLERYDDAEYEWAFYAPTPAPLYRGARQRDHFVALAEAHQSGGAYWSDQRKAEFAIDAENIFWLPAAVNSEKWAWDPDGWRPASAAAHQRYAVRWIRIKQKWSLDFDSAEIAALRELLRTPP